MTDDDPRPPDDDGFTLDNPLIRGIFDRVASGQLVDVPGLSTPADRPRPALPPTDLGRALAGYIILIDNRLGPDEAFNASRLATESGVDPGTLSKILSGDTPRPYDSTLAKLADTLQAYGLITVTADLLKALRDGTHRLPTAHDERSAEWQVLLDQILALPGDWPEFFLTINRTLLTWAAWLANPPQSE